MMMGTRDTLIELLRPGKCAKSTTGKTENLECDFEDHLPD